MPRRSAYQRRLLLAALIIIVAGLAIATGILSAQKPKTNDDWRQTLATLSQSYHETPRDQQTSAPSFKFPRSNDPSKGRTPLKGTITPSSKHAGWFRYTAPDNQFSIELPSTGWYVQEWWADEGPVHDSIDIRSDHGVYILIYPQVSPFIERVLIDSLRSSNGAEGGAIGDYKTVVISPVTESSVYGLGTGRLIVFRNFPVIIRTFDRMFPPDKSYLSEVDMILETLKL